MVPVVVVREASRQVSGADDDPPVQPVGVPRSATMTVFPLACSSTARAMPMPLVEPGMKMVFPEIFMLPVWAAGRPSEWFPLPSASLKPDR